MAERSDSLTPPHNAPITPGETAMPPPQAAPLQVELQFNGNDNSSVTFKMKSTMKLKKAMEAYSARVQRPVDQLRFLFEGARLEEDDTPQKYEMTDGDIVDVHMEQIGGASDLSRDWVSVDDAEKKLKKAIFENGLLHALVASQKESIEDFTAINQLLKADIDAHKKSNKELAEKASLAETTTQGMAKSNSQHVQLNRKLENTLNNTLAMVHVLSNDKFDMKATLVAKECEVGELKDAVATNECAIGTLMQENNVLQATSESASQVATAAIEKLTLENRDLKAALAVKQRALDSAIQQNHDLHAAVVAKESALDSTNMDNEALRAALDSANLDKEALHAAINSVNKDIDDLHATVITKELALDTVTLDKKALRAALIATNKENNDLHAAVVANECALDKGLEKQRVLKKTISKKEREIDSDLEEVIRSDSFLLDFDRS